METRCNGCMRIKDAAPRCALCGWLETDQNGYYQLPVGTVLRNQYRIGRVLGQGGFGITYLGWDMDLAIPVAIKEYYPRSQVGRDQGTTVIVTEDAQFFEEGKERFLKEARTLAKLQKLPNIVQVHTFFKENNTTYIVMELIEGVTLREHIRRRGGKLEVEETFSILRPILHTMEQVHEAGMIHRDISPDNIMIQPDGTVKILDFGTARAVDLAAGKLTHETQPVLKRGFTPFEQMGSGRDIDQRVDEYALCCTIYYCLTGSRPVEAYERLRGKPIPWAQISGLTPGQVAALEKGAAVLAEERFPDLKSLEEALFSETVPDSGSVQQKTEKEDAAPPKPPEPDEEFTELIDTHQKTKSGGGTLVLLCILLMALMGAGIYFIPEVRQTITQNELYQKTMSALDSGDQQDVRKLAKKQAKTISASNAHTVALRSDGTVVSTVVQAGNYKYGQDAVSGWEDIVSVAAGGYHTVGLKTDGTVVAVGYSGDSRCNVSDWENIVAVAAGTYHTVGLRIDGTVVAAGSDGYHQCDVSDWEDIVAIDAGHCHTIGLKSDGTVVSTAVTSGQENYGQCQVSDWTDIVAIAAGPYSSIGLKSDGTVIAVGYNGYGQCNLEQWQDIVAVDAGLQHTIGLKSDGTVVTAGSNSYGWCDVSDWQEIAAVAVGWDYTVGLKSDGTVLAVGNNAEGQCNVSEWVDIRTPGFW